VAPYKIVVTDYIEPDLTWEAEQFGQLGVDFASHQLKFGSPAELVAAAAEADVVIVNMARCSADVIAGLRRCRLLIRHGIGYDNVDVAAASRRGIVVANIPDYCVNEVAEQAVMLMLACQRKLLHQGAILRASAAKGQWVFAAIAPIYRLQGKTVGIVGLGRIGGTVFQMLQGFGVRLAVCDPYLSAERRQRFGVTPIPLAELLPQADLVTIHTPLNAETHHLFDTQQFKQMKPTAVLINTARGAIVNLHALDLALRQGDLALAGIDVYEQEPPPPDFPLLHNERAICTAHLAWLSEESGWIIRQRIVADVQRFLRGEPPLSQVNPEVALRPPAA
jgi:D-3-phosphoglycerate dehydrogenase